ncbi:MAG: bifunctional diaminohydroxyphosphoribosylaminopyrimidine deaminase/5-amino-6-(5-phosphoribosylamino)uracil reductase RibD, partial [Spirochaetaceae bacterium]
MNDSFWMGMAIEHARKGGRNVSPNPQVGAVIVQDGRIIGEAYHAKYGGPHAEKGAIDDARLRTGQQKFPNAILYCTLEPCCYRSPQKHQPPCTEAIIEAGIRHVVIAHHDPNPMVSGKGVAALRAAGCRVRLDVCKEEAMELNPGFITRMQTGRPFVTLKIAQSLDGRIAASSGDSKWITGEKAREQGHRLRAEHDAVLV